MKAYNSLQLKAIFNSFFEILLKTSSRNESLKLIAEKASDFFGDFITPGNIGISDEIAINFIEILDQVMYEFKENTEYQSNIRDYIIEDLYTKISLNLEALQDINLYRKNIKNRSLIYDDVIIIRVRQLSDLIPLLIQESEEITNLQKPIIKTLLYFNDPSFYKLYYNSYKNSLNGFIRAAALLGIKYYENKIPIINSLDDSEISNRKIINYANKFDLSKIYNNPLPKTKEEMTFVLLHLECIINSINDNKSFQWMIQTLDSIPAMNFQNSWLHEVNNAISTILLNINIDRLIEYFDGEEKMIRAVNFIDSLPKNIFNRLTGRLNLMGMPFQLKLHSIIEKKKINIETYNSNTFNYICWNSTRTI